MTIGFSILVSGYRMILTNSISAYQTSSIQPPASILTQEWILLTIDIF